MPVQLQFTQMKNVSIHFFWLYFSQINICSVEDLELFYEQIIGVPLLLRVWVEFSQNDYVGAAQPDIQFEGLRY